MGQSAACPIVNHIRKCARRRNADHHEKSIRFVIIQTSRVDETVNKYYKLSLNLTNTVFLRIRNDLLNFKFLKVRILITIVP